MILEVTTVGCCTSARRIEVPQVIIIRAVIARADRAETMEWWPGGVKQYTFNDREHALTQAAAAMCKRRLEPKYQTDKTGRWQHRLLPYNPFHAANHIRLGDLGPDFAAVVMASECPEYVDAYEIMSHA